jgi:hypothetical protein
MLLDTIHGIIDRRILLNYHIDPEALQQVLPPGFRPKIFRGKGIGGVCMIRFRELRPRKIPAWLGLKSENAAHRIAVEWDEDDGTKEGVFIPRRDTNSTFNKLFGGRVFPGIFNKGTFQGSGSASATQQQLVRRCPTSRLFLFTWRDRLLCDARAGPLSWDGASEPGLEHSADGSGGCTHQFLF